MPIRRVERAEEVARAALWLGPDDSSFVTGTVLPIDRGQSAGNKPGQMFRQDQEMAAG